MSKHKIWTIHQVLFFCIILSAERQQDILSSSVEKDKVTDATIDKMVKGALNSRLNFQLQIVKKSVGMASNATSSTSSLGSFFSKPGASDLIQCRRMKIVALCTPTITIKQKSMAAKRMATAREQIAIEAVIEPRSIVKSNLSSKGFRSLMSVMKTNRRTIKKVTYKPVASFFLVQTSYFVQISLSFMVSQKGCINLELIHSLYNFLFRLQHILRCIKLLELLLN